MYRPRVCLIAAALCLQPCFGEILDPSEDELEEVTVTAHRIETRSVLPVESLSKYDIEARVSLIGADVLAPLASLAPSCAGAFGSQAQIRVRGAEANHLQVLVDGIEVNDPATGSEFAFAHLDLAGIGRVEFLPGAQSAVWGSDALAGVLQLLSRQEPDLRRLELAGGSNSERLGRIELGNVFTQGRYRLTASHYDTQGTNAALEGDEDDGYEHDSVHFSGRIHAENKGLSLVLRRVDALSEFDPTGFPTYLPVDGDSESSVKFQAAKIAVDGSFLEDRWKQAFELKHLDTRTLTDANGDRISRFEGTRNTLSLISHITLSAQHRLTGLLEYEAEGFRQAAAASFFGDPNYAAKVSTKSAALEHLANWGRLSTSLSARFDSHSDFEKITSFRAGLRYRVAPRLSIFANLGTGTKNPSFIERFGYTPGSFIGNPKLRPEYNRHRSVGVDWCAGKAACVHLALFQDKLKDEINGFAWSGVGFTAINLDGTSERQGLELRTNAEFAETMFTGAYMFVDSNAPDGATEVRRPRHQGHLSLRRSFLEGKLDLLLGARLSGESLDLEFSTGERRAVHLRQRELVYLTARYTLTQSILLYLRVENMLDDDGQEIYGYAPPGRRASLGVQLSW